MKGPIIMGTMNKFVCYLPSINGDHMGGEVPSSSVGKQFTCTDHSPNVNFIIFIYQIENNLNQIAHS